MRYIVSIWLLVYFCFPLKSQIIFEQDIIRGGVTGGGFSTGQGSGTGQFQIFIEPGSTIKKAYLFCLGINEPQTLSYELNNETYSFDNVDKVTSWEQSFIGAENASIYAKDITTNISANITNYNVSITQSSDLPIMGGLYLVVLYENLSLPNTAISIVLNNQDLNNFENYNIDDLFPFNSSNPVGLSIFTDRICDTLIDGSYIYVNGTNIGLIGGNDNVNSTFNCSGVKGHFYYQNNQLIGLDDDMQNNSMGGTDGLADVASLILNNSTSLNWSFEWQSQSSNINRFNMYLSFFLTYTTPCSLFNTTISANQTLCKGDSTQLEATGGIDYEWAPSTGLSCDDCPSPIAYPENSTTYTCRIWSTDSCSKVLPVRINVSNPEPDTVVVTPATCGSENGKIQVGNIPFGSVTEPPYTYSINGESQSDTLFANLAGGMYELTVTDANGCTWSDSITVEEEIKTVAFSLIDPKEGHTPFVVTANAGSSQNATDYLWLTDNTEIPGEDFEYEYLAAGEYDLCLLSWNNELRCADTVCNKIIVHPEFFVRIPNVFTPNNDGDNDIFSIKIQEVQSIKWQIYNRWGNVLNHGKKDFTTGDFQTLDLWHGDTPQFKPAPDGVYYYKIDVESFGGVVEQLVGDVSLGR